MGEMLVNEVILGRSREAAQRGELVFVQGMKQGRTGQLDSTTYSCG